VNEPASHISGQLDLFSLLSVEAYDAQKSAESQTALLNGLLADPELMAFLRRPSNIVRSVAFSSDCTTLASGSNNETIRL